jgi:DNA-binding NtrC family response regulator
VDAVTERVLVIEDDPKVVAPQVGAARPRAAVRGTTWSGLGAEPWTAAPADVVVAVLAEPVLSRAQELLPALAGETGVLAVLPERGSGPLVSLARAAMDFVLSPVRPDELCQRLERVLGRNGEAEVERRLADTLGLSQLVGSDPAFQALMERLPLAARSGSPVLLVGESGTGKEMCARAIHQLSVRRDLPFVAVDCGAVPDHLFENELFGHVRGAYTDARTDQKGLVQMAERGTLFLDEVDALSPSAQAKLLRFLQEKTYKPLGSERIARADVRVLAASNRDLDLAVAERRFRQDLLFRLDVLRLPLVPLRQRPADIAVLARHFLRSFGQGPERRFSPGALERLRAHAWPGNVRELSNVVERACVFATGPVIEARDITLGSGGGGEGPAREAGGFREARARALARFEQDYVQDLMRRHDGNVTRAAREAQKERRAFGRLVKKYAHARPADDDADASPAVPEQPGPDTAR